jgi:hypothetical protein
MSRVDVRNMPRLSLFNLLKRRKTTLERFVKESGIQTYNALVTQCGKLGVQSPTQQEYEVVFPTIVNSPAEGVVVADPLPVIDDLSGREIDPEAPVSYPGVEVTFSPEEPEAWKPPRRKRASTSR